MATKTQKKAAEVGRPQPGAGDETGKQAAKLAAKRDEEQAETAKSMAMATAAARRTDLADEVVDLTAKPAERKKTPAVVEPDGQGGETTVQQNEPIVPQKAKVTVRANYDMEDVTIGAGTSYSFEAGRRYLVPHAVAEHLHERGYVDIVD